MIYTSYFGNMKSLPINTVPIAICSKVPDWYNGLHYPILSPTYSIFSEWKSGGDKEKFTERFNREVLDELNPSDVVFELICIMPYEYRIQNFITNCTIWNNNSLHIALLCYEKSDDFCHRHLVREWLNKNNIRCEEWRN